MRKRTLSTAACALAAMLAAAPASAQTSMIDGTDPDALRSVLSGFGSAELTTDDVGDPQIRGRISGYLYRVDFYGCSDNQNCTGVLFRAGFEKPVSLEVVNAWNQEKRYGQAYRNEDGTATVAMAVNLRYGVERRNFDDTADWWRIVLDEFVQHIDFE